MFWLLYFWKANYYNCLTIDYSLLSDFYDKMAWCQWATGVSKSNLCWPLVQYKKNPLSFHIFSSFESRWGLTHGLVDVFHTPAARLIKYWDARRQIFSKSVVLDAVHPSPTPLQPELFGGPRGRTGMRSIPPRRGSHFGSSLSLQSTCCCTCRDYLPLSKSIFSAELWTDAVFIWLHIEAGNLCCNFDFNVAFL